ncbi:hypothetical protein [Yersinia mollaretii]|nr:hypothetical protein [Yersinia mollaretii]
MSPQSLHESVTGVNEDSQRTCSLKYDGYSMARGLATDLHNKLAV